MHDLFKMADCHGILMATSAFNVEDEQPLTIGRSLPRQRQSVVYFCSSRVRTFILGVGFGRSKT